MRNVENSVFNRDAGNGELPETNAPIFVDEHIANRYNGLTVELSSVKDDEERISQSLNLRRRLVRE